jgi:hypothetical protein
MFAVSTPHSAGFIRRAPEQIAAQTRVAIPKAPPLLVGPDQFHDRLLNDPRSNAEGPNIAGGAFVQTVKIVDITGALSSRSAPPTENP